MHVLVSGASGFIGGELSAQLETHGHTVLRLTRGVPRRPGEFAWSPRDRAIDPEAIEQADAVINLAGAPTSRIPWTTAYKRELLYSRVNGTRTIAEAIAASTNPPAAFLNASAVGYYGSRPGERLTEDSAKGEGFLSDLVEAWELAARLAEATTRVVTFRTGLVIGRGGALTPLLPLTRLGLGARMGSGRQYWPWVSLYDEAAAIRHLLESPLEGVVNVVGPIPATSVAVTRALARVLERWHPWIVPEFAIGMLGDAGRDLLLADGFEFRDETIDAAMAALLR